MSLIPNGTKVEFTDADGNVHFGVVMNFVPRDDILDETNDFKGGYHIVTYHVVDTDKVRVTPTTPIED